MHPEYYFEQAEKVIERYNGKKPFMLMLKAFFKENRKMGKRDRENISTLCLNYFRGAKLFDAKNDIRTKIKLANRYLLSEKRDQYLFAYLKDQLDDYEEPTSLLFNYYFPLSSQISSKIDRESFINKHFKIPSFFIRIRKNKEFVLNELKELNIDFEAINDECLQIEQGSVLQNSQSYQKGFFEIQDLASQELLKSLPKINNNAKVWDCCCGAGGKSIHLMDLYPNINLFSSDKRAGILKNFELRVKRNQLEHREPIQFDLLESELNPWETKFDMILADLPCSGSGTWHRTPEHLVYFNAEKLEEYTILQRAICGSVLNSLESGGILIYCSCSVYEEENEQNVKRICQEHKLKLETSHYFSFPQLSGESHYMAVLRK